MTASSPLVSLEEILRFTPHRYPMLLLDRGEEFEPFRRMVGIKTVSQTEPYLAAAGTTDEHFPNVLILEAMGQTGGVMMGKSLQVAPDGKFVAFIAMDNIRFLRRARSGDELRMPVTVTKYREDYFHFHAEAYLNGRLAAECDFSGVASNRS
ncbi:MAG: 3-hydroxyacyl-ACP dehydratase FabZ family protein [Asticcacaulis sp.]|uniref:3-hydroxyacyl-ACP dehydratase FabZ family protein n=1 Tax=Asticcacaulis sp. TaxID=1872648 RepID=UPI003F7CB3D6